MSSSKDIVLFHYPFSPFSKRVIWMLNFRKIPYTECIQPMILPRPDLTTLGISYRRIPILSIGRDIYHDTRLILLKLSQLFPPSPSHPPLTASSPSQAALENLLDIWVIDSGIFARSAQLIMNASNAMKDPKFVEDRKNFTTGLPMSMEGMRAVRPEAVVDIRSAFEFFENTLLADGREWILGSQKPTLADIKGVWPLVWLKGVPNALPQAHISPSIFPKTFAWLARFQAYAKANAVKPISLKGPEVALKIENADYAEEEGSVAEDDPSGLKKGQEVLVWPIDSGSRNKDKGKLVSLSWDEIVIESKTQSERTVRIHTPRHGFRIAPIDASKL